MLDANGRNLEALTLSGKHVVLNKAPHCITSVCVLLSAADRWQALQQLRCCIQAVAPQPLSAAPCMPLWEAFADGATTLLQVLVASCRPKAFAGLWCMRCLHSAYVSAKALTSTTT